MVHEALVLCMPAQIPMLSWFLAMLLTAEGEYRVLCCAKRVDCCWDGGGLSALKAS